MKIVILVILSCPERVLTIELLVVVPEQKGKRQALNTWAEEV